MGKPPRKKGMMERRKRPRSRKSPGVKPDSALRTLKKDSCANCAKSLKGSERALFVEEEIGRIFCSEECISEYFTPDVEVLEQEKYKLDPILYAVVKDQEIPIMVWDADGNIIPPPA